MNKQNETTQTAIYYALAACLHNVEKLLARHGDARTVLDTGRYEGIAMVLDTIVEQAIEEGMDKQDFQEILMELCVIHSIPVRIYYTMAKRMFGDWE